MRKILSLVVLTVVAAMIMGCSATANDSTGTITVTNSTGKDAQNVKVGSTSFGTVSKGQTITLAFYSSENNAKVNCDGFDPEDDLLGNDRDGKIDLKLGYQYTLRIYENTDGDDVFNITGSEVDDDGSKTME